MDKKRILINSFPRTGNTFMFSMIYRIVEDNDLNISIYTHTHSHFLFKLNKDPNLLQISFIRDPVETLTSLYFMRTETDENDDDFQIDIKNIKNIIEIYCEFYSEWLNNPNSSIMIPFDYFINNAEDTCYKIMKEFLYPVEKIIIPNDNEIKLIMEKNQANLSIFKKNIPSSKKYNNLKYKKISDIIKFEKEFKMAEEIYNKIINHSNLWKP